MRAIDLFEGDLIPGGKAQGRPASDFDAEQLKRGIKVEMEHTDDPAVAKEIAKDHLAEDPEYYTMLARCHTEGLLGEKKISYKARKKLPKKEFAIPGKAPKSGSYPIDTKNRARNALARVSQHGTGSEKSKVRRAVHRKYPDIGEHLDRILPEPPLRR